MLSFFRSKNTNLKLEIEPHKKRPITLETSEEKFDGLRGTPTRSNGRAAIEAMAPIGVPRRKATGGKHGTGATCPYPFFRAIRASRIWDG